MARDWEDETATLRLLEARLQELAPDNISELPLAMSKERLADGSFTYGIHLHVKVRGVTEYDVEAYAKTFAGALRRAYLGLTSEAKLRRQANHANAQFGIAV